MGILGAIILRGIMVVVGSAIIHTFRPLLLLCAALLIFSAYQVLIIGEDDDDDEDLSDNMCVVWASKCVPVDAGYHGADFMHEGKCTPLLLPSLVSLRTPSSCGPHVCAQSCASGPSTPWS